MADSTPPTLGCARRDFFGTLICALLPTQHPLTYDDLLSWFEYIEAQFSGAFQSLHTAWLHFLDYSDSSDSVAWYSFLKDMIGVIRRYPVERLVTIDGIAEDITILKSKSYPLENPAAGRQSILSAIGCLTMLYEPGVQAKPNLLAVNVSSSKTSKLHAQVAEDAAQRAVVKLLDGFELLPAAHSLDDLLFGSFLNFFTLSVVAKVKVEPVHHVTSHLVFNPGSRRLSVFAHPAFSAMYLDPAFDTGFQRRLLRDMVPSEDYENMRHFHQEVLLSYRFLFAYDGKSRDRFMKYQQIHRHSRFWRRLLFRENLWTRLFDPSHRPTSTSLPQTYWPEAVKDLDGTLIEQTNYDAASDFLFLGPRLLQLQKYCSRQNPNKWSEIFWDQRHKQQWITLWAAIMIGGASVFLSLVQVILAGFAAAGQHAAPASTDTASMLRTS